MTTPDPLQDADGPGNARAIRVLVVAHYASVRAGLHSLLEGQAGITVIGEARALDEAETAVLDFDVDVILYDHFEEDGGRLLTAAANQHRAIVVLGEDARDLPDLASAPLSGWAYLNKEAGREELAAAVRAVAAGLIVLDHSAISHVLFGARPMLRSGPEVHEETSLTAREMEVLKLMAAGLPNKNIAARLNISSNTAKFHVASILSKLGASSRTEAVAVGVRRGLLAL